MYLTKKFFCICLFLWRFWDTLIRLYSLRVWLNFKAHGKSCPFVHLAKVRVVVSISHAFRGWLGFESAFRYILLLAIIVCQTGWLFVVTCNSGQSDEIKAVLVERESTLVLELSTCLLVHIDSCLSFVPFWGCQVNHHFANVTIVSWALYWSRTSMLAAQLWSLLVNTRWTSMLLDSHKVCFISMAF